MKTEYRPIAMRCTQDQFDSIKDRIPKNIPHLGNFDVFPFLEIHHHYVTNSTRESLSRDTEIHETFDGELFLDCCGREKEECITQEQKYDIIKEYIKDKVWNSEELQSRFIFDDGTKSPWQDEIPYKHQYRIKP